MTTPSASAEAARRLREAYSAGAVEPLRDLIEAADVDGAYEVQRLNIEHWVAAGRRIVGRKVGLTAERVQQQLGVDQPDFGVLFEDMRIEDGGVIDFGRLLQPRIEAEIALVLARDLDDPECSAETVAAATDHAVAALEIVDSRVADWRITIADTVADNASSGLFVLSVERRLLEEVDLIGCGMTMSIDGVVVSTGTGAACLGSPLNSAAWLARVLASRGDPLRAGDIVLTGALGPMVALPAGARVEARIDGFGTVSVSTNGAAT
jgi:2-keto-4-pentenoate hydratase